MRFGAFEANLTSRELRKHGIPVKVYDQPFQILAILIASPGELVTREEIQQKLWPTGTFVDFENGLNSAVNRLRDALGDSADEPKFIETVPRRGYRFIAPVQRVNGNAGPKHEPSVRRQWRWLAIGGLAAVFFISSIGVWWFSRTHKTALNFAARDWVLISNFENRTGNPLLDGTMEYALERELSNSQFVNVVPRERVGDALQLMKRPLDTKIDAAVGREICLRDGGIRVLLTGRVEKLGTTYVLGAELVDPTSGAAVASMSEEDSADSQLAAAVRRLSNRVREALGEKRGLVQQSEKRLEKVTTPSLHALQLYTQANDLMRVNQAAAAELLERAVAEDPGFASAHLLLGWTRHNRRNDVQARPEFQRAFDLADTTPDRERFFIVGSYYGAVAKDGQKAADTYEALLQLYPDHFWAANNLVSFYAIHFRGEDYGRILLRMADLRPYDLFVNAGAVWEKGVRQQDPQGAQPYLERASAILAAQGENADQRDLLPGAVLDPSLATWVKLFPAYQFWVEGNVASSHAVVREAERTSKAIDLSRLVLFYLTFGEVKEAEQHLRNADAGDREEFSPVVEWMRGTWSPAESHSSNSRYNDTLGSYAAFLRVRPDLGSKMEHASDNQLPSESPWRALNNGIESIVRGDTARGISLLEQGLKATQSRPIAPFFMAAESLAEAYRKQGKTDDALRVLQLASTKKTLTYDFFTGGITAAFWMRTEFQLADLYREMGRVAEAAQIEDELRKMLVYADADYPMLIELQKRKLWLRP